MLLKEEKDDKNAVVCFFDSSNILSCKYRIDTKQLAVIYASGYQYVFEDIGFYTYSEFKSAESQGYYFNTNIRNKYDFEKVENKIDVKVIKEYIENIKNNK